MKKRPKISPKKAISKIKGISIRYIFLLLIGIILSFSNIFYDLLLKLTIYPVNLLLNLSYDSIITGNTILIESIAIEIIPACVAVSAYFLLLILNLTTSMSYKKRIHSLLFSFLTLLILNILRIFILSILLLQNFASFDILHKIFWYFLSTLMVVLIWFLTVYLFKIKEIPIYSDISFLLKQRKSK